MSTEQPINDPFVIMLVELTWASGKLLREYTFLLDPPGYVPEQPAQAAVQAVPPVTNPPAETAATPAVQAAPVVQPVTAAPPVGQAAPAETAVASAPGGKPLIAAEALPELEE